MILCLHFQEPPPQQPPPPLQDPPLALHGELFAISGPDGDTIFPTRAAFEGQMRLHVEMGGWDQLKFIFPPEFEDYVLRIIQRPNVEVLRTPGAIELRKCWHEQAACVGGGAAGFGWLWWRKEALAAAGRAAGNHGARVPFLLQAQFLAEGVAVGMGTTLAWRYTLPRLLMQTYTIIMSKSPGTDRVEVIRVTDGEAARGLLLGREVEELLEELVGQEELREEIRSFARLQYAARKGAPGAVCWHNPVVLRGGRGTGKTTVARILGKVLQRVGIAKSEVVLEVQRADLVGEDAVLTALKTRARIREARGGVLFVDEAHGLLGFALDFRRVALRLIVQSMKERGDPVVVFAGRPTDMDALLRVDELRSTVPRTFELQNYGPAALAGIFLLKVRGAGLQLEGNVTGERVAGLLWGMDPGWLLRHNGHAAVRLLATSQDEQGRRLSAQEQQVPEGSAARRTLVWGDLERGAEAILRTAAEAV
uniref:AAA+ ATPase domain-containing protein n=1 Tax=Alexandrium monilatum TaxID=311494 RepID=A0A7S4SGL1_9DINO